MNRKQKGKKVSLKKEEQRRYIRLKTHHLLKYRIIRDETEIISFSRNISAGGVLFFIRQDLPLNCVIDLKINFPFYPEPVTVIAKIVRKDYSKVKGGYEMGAEFINIEDGVQDFLNQKIAGVKVLTNKKRAAKRRKQELIFLVFFLLILLGVLIYKFNIYQIIFSLIQNK